MDNQILNLKKYLHVYHEFHSHDEQICHGLEQYQIKYKCSHEYIQ